MVSLRAFAHYHLVAPLLKARYRPRAAGEWLHLGTGHGQWWVPAYIVRPGVVAYLGGAGGDISFDTELHARGLIVRCFDPTPNSGRYVSSVAPQDARFAFVPIGWWSEKGTIPLFEPINPDDFSHSATNLFSTSTAVDLPVDSIAGCMAALGDQRIDLVKIDVEGAEKEVLRGMLRDNILPEVVCVEFDPPLREVLRTVKAVRAAGYTLEKIDGWNYTFTRPTNDGTP